jgi:HNH endonuclease
VGGKAMSFSEATRAAVAARAGHRCEYCHLATRGQVGTFPIDHVTPRSQAGPTVLGNLALACSVCNGHKWKYSNDVDPESGEVVPLFNPRTDVWSHHFRRSREQVGVLEGLTPCGRATIARLQMNDAEIVVARQLLAELGLFSEVLP